MFSFSTLSTKVVKALNSMGFSKPTPIQKLAIPLALEGKDLLVQARTGTGKTGAFGIPLVERIKKGERALILAPTRELALQIRDHLRDIARFSGLKVYAFYGGSPVVKDLKLLENFIPDIVVGTPGRIKDLIGRGALPTDGFRYLVLDEVDVMLDMGFREDIEWIVSKLPSERQTLFVSATVPPEIKRIARKFMKPDFRHVKADTEELKPKIREKIISTFSEAHKYKELENILKNLGSGKAIVFTKTRRDAKDLASRLIKDGFRVEALHGDLPQRKREEVMKRFRNGYVRVLIATDVASRGLDIEGVDLIVNFHLPEDPKVYTHRIGRTGRFGSEGTAVSLVSPAERKNLMRIKRVRGSLQHS